MPVVGVGSQAVSCSLSVCGACTMSLPIKLQKISEWVSTIAKAAKTTTDFAVETGFLQDTLKEICDRAGVAGAVFKLGAMALDLTSSEVDAETRIGAHLTRTFVKTLDAQLAKQDESDAYKYVSVEQWKAYQKTGLEKAAKTTLAAEFTWLGVIGQRGRKSSRSWPLVNELADFSRRAVLEAAEAAGAADEDLSRFADKVRGLVHEALSAAVDGFIEDPVIEAAFRIETPKVARDALRQVNEQYVMLKSAHLFNEVPQDKLFISPTIRVADYSQGDVEEDWDKIEAQEGGDEFLANEVTKLAGTSRVIVVEGEMGIGKSCLMRKVAASLAEQFLLDQKQAVLSANWRDIYDDSNLIEGIQRDLENDYGLPIPGLEEEEGLVFVIDGFDEMRSHEEVVVDRYFQSLVRLARDHKSPLVLAMRSTVVTNTIKRQWKDHDVLVIKVDSFSDEDTDQWAKRWCDYRQVNDVSGDGLRKLCGGVEELTRTPLLLFMLARYVQPVSKDRTEALTRSEIFRTFVDETIRGKAQQSGETAGIEVKEKHFRYLLQEIAWIASWPKHGGKCPTRVLRERICGSNQDLQEMFGFDNIRTPFVLQFFQPGDHVDEFEFHPEGFRHYLLAEWSVRTQWEAMLYDDTDPEYPTGRRRDDARNALAQFSLQEVERDLVNEIYEQLPDMLAFGSVEQQHVRDVFGIPASTAVRRLFDRVKREANDPPNCTWSADGAVGVPEGHSTVKALETTRLLSNHWDHSFLALFGLARGLDSVSEGSLLSSRTALSELANLKAAIVGGVAVLPFNLQNVNLSSAFLENLVGPGKFQRVNLTTSALARIYLQGKNLDGAELQGANLLLANLRSASLRKTNLKNANLEEAILILADLRGADLRGADLEGADLRGADLRGADLRMARLHWASMEEVRLDGAQLQGADLNMAKLRESDLVGVDVEGVVNMERVSAGGLFETLIER